MKDLHCSNGANPDIGGFGVIVSAFTQVSVVGLVGWVLYFATGDFHIILGALKRTRTHIRTGPRSALRRYLSAPSVFVSSITITQQAYSAPLTAGLIDTRQVLRVQLLQDFTLYLSDLHTFAGISYLVAAFSQLSSIKRMDMYHMAVIQQIAWFPPQAHAQALYYSFVPGLEGFTVRMVAILVYYVQFLAFEGVYLAQLVQAKRTGKWCDPQGNDSIPWVIAGILFVTWTYLPLWDVIRDRMRYWREMRRSKKDDDEKETGLDLLVFVESPLAPTPWADVSVLQRGIAVVKFVGRMLETRLFNLIAITVWVTLQTIEFDQAKRDYLNDPEEDQWGLGQILAVAAIASIAFEAYKLYQRYEKDKDTPISRLPNTSIAFRFPQFYMMSRDPHAV